ncbi:MAG: peptidase PmbA [Pelotomaculum sp. PtaB.Bin013]|uniref:TldD/PmbA family protein n=1 Tax=Pelotomaculum isophthalicicum JI TaxID=947010 RepID=A0A9X4JWD8_9FIRM|nr:TldD/PmbA family protein [Pelotomaculum isophthalicicum]MDF9408938.1 TldD/PmbA family protein [Pelotomaculum isophthalicicum JI]OPX89913.1 MAG: peptidase PmbA [Pelotomaculum sp. PtaB.Bin013]
MGRDETNLGIAEAAVKLAGKQGAEQVEAYISRQKELNIDVRNGHVETMKFAEDSGLGLRVICGTRSGFSYSTDLSVEGIKTTVRQALANCGKTALDPYHSLPAPDMVYPELDLYDPDIREATIEAKIDLARSMEQTALDYDPRVKIIESATYQDGEVLVTIVNSRGMKLTCQRGYCGIYLALAASEGHDTQNGFALDYRLKYKQLNPDKVGREAAQRAVRMLGATPFPTKKTIVVLDPYVATNFLSLIAPALTSEAVQKGRSLFAGKVGDKMISEKLTIIDDGALNSGIASTPFDGEGVATASTVLIKDGILQGFLYNSYTAAKENMRSTGNGVRSSFKGTPEVGTTNFFIDTGSTPVDNMIKDVTDGIYITEVMGMHTANPISGDFSVGVAGLWIEEGKLTKPVRGMALGGNIIDLLASVDAVGNDLQFYGSKGSPTLRLAEMTVSGQ